MIRWNKVTWYSQAIAIILFVGVFFLGYYIGRSCGTTDAQQNQTQ
jgi:hypothetical protein